MLCELCGKKEGTTRVIVEGSSIVSCDKCKSFGKVIEVIKPQNFEQKKQFSKPANEFAPTESIVEDYSKKIKNAREQLGKTQEEFAQLLREKVSIVHKLETGQFEPPIDTAKKIEKILRIMLVEVIEQTVQETPKAQKTEGFTIGDFIKLKGKNA